MRVYSAYSLLHCDLMMIFEFEFRSITRKAEQVAIACILYSLQSLSHMHYLPASKLL
jgi:hypothetical protein